MTNVKSTAELTVTYYTSPPCDCGAESCIHGATFTAGDCPVSYANLALAQMKMQPEVWGDIEVVRLVFSNDWQCIVEPGGVGCGSAMKHEVRPEIVWCKGNSGCGGCH